MSIPFCHFSLILHSIALNSLMWISEKDQLAKTFAQRQLLRTVRHKYSENCNISIVDEVFHYLIRYSHEIHFLSTFSSVHSVIRVWTENWMLKTVIGRILIWKGVFSHWAYKRCTVKKVSNLRKRLRRVATEINVLYECDWMNVFTL